MTFDPFYLPDGLPEPSDDGRADHLPGKRVPALELKAASGGHLRLDRLAEPTVIVCYPRIGSPDLPPPAGWDDIPGARGCSLQAHRYAKHHETFSARGATIVGVSGQDHQEQIEATARLTLPYQLLSDPDLDLADTLGLPTFEAHGRKYQARITLLVRGGCIDEVIYPIFPPGVDAEHAIAWLDRRRGETAGPSR